MAWTNPDPFRGLDFTPDERAALRKAKFPDAAAVWAAAGDGSVQPLGRLVERSGIPAARLQEVLARAGQRALRPSRTGLIARHWLDAVLLGGAMLFAWLALREPPRPGEARHLRASGTIAAFSVMDTAWLADSVAPAPADAIGAGRDAQGRVLLRTLAAGEPLTEAHLGPRLPADALTGRSVLSVAARPTPKGAQPRVGTRIGLMLAPREAGGAGAVIRDALVLSATAGDSALNLLVALRAADLATAAALLGNADVHVVAAAPR